MRRGRYSHRHGVNQAQEPLVIVKRDCAVTSGDGSSLVAPRVGDRNQVDLRHGGKYARVVLTKVPHAHDADAQPRHAVLPRSRARPCLPRCWLSMNSSSLFTSAQRWPCESRIVAACPAPIRADKSDGVPRATPRSPRR